MLLNRHLTLFYLQSTTTYLRTQEGVWKEMSLNKFAVVCCSYDALSTESNATRLSTDLTRHVIG